MSVVLASGILAISIDLELDAERRGLDQQQALETITERLLALLAKFQLKATWAVADPAVSAATDRLTSSAGEHEIAILADHTWAGRAAGRSRFAREIARRVTRARAVGLDVSTLVLRDGTLDDQLDLAVKHGIRALRASYDTMRDSAWFAARAVAQPWSPRFGLWEMPPSLRLPGVSNWRPGGGGTRAAKRGIDQAAAARSVYHLMIDGLLLATAGKSAERVLEKVLRHADRRRQQGTLQVMTLASTAQCLTGDRHGTPARSILRPAA